MEENEDGSGVGAAVAAALITGIANIGLNAWQNRQNRKNWELQNEYNSPFSQMERYRQAGLNPNLIYGSGQNASAGNAGAIAPYQSQKLDAMDVANFANALMSLKLGRKNLDKTDAETAVSLAQAKNVELQNQRSALENHYLDSYLNMRNRQSALNLAYISGQIGLQEYNKRHLQAQIEQLIENTAFTKYQRTVERPAILNIRTQELYNATRRLNEEIQNWAIGRTHTDLQNQLLGKDIRWYNWKNGVQLGRDVLSGLGTAIGGIGFGLKRAFMPTIGKIGSTTYWPDGGYTQTHYGPIGRSGIRD